MAHLMIPSSVPNEAECITMSPNGDAKFAATPSIATKRVNPIPLIWHKVVALHLAGKTIDEIAEEVDYNRMSISRILRDPRVEQVRQMLMEDIQRDFDSLYSTVVKNLREQLASKDTTVQQAAQNQWFKAAGKFAPKTSGITNNITAEDVVVQILNGNVQAGR